MKPTGSSRVFQKTRIKVCLILKISQKSRAGSYLIQSLIKNRDWNCLISKFRNKHNWRSLKKSNNNLKLVHSSLLEKKIEMRNIHDVSLKMNSCLFHNNTLWTFPKIWGWMKTTSFPQPLPYNTLSFWKFDFILLIAFSFSAKWIRF
jgi:hypothetical protein